ncbi:hypothetical protein J3Q64DRAFT_1729799 [Phycomyces blakesleeanus]|uniref:Pentacotripeptide-repeat region of PRORP domain-containing protein n=2 Tax=Phycomyces blakesleeanus TaxID=4837 RepID=A0A163AVV0_PHYB8|nr:hypothetical protein PHYBLDRAFT_59697 [Phycomyces blakesleeanus NRRL 1555(-)]OAD76161.1 hypothetical protein PHYBLDRAFT_59697 [Phycomyces blakesleeanus NRRL 1555(-)]|eukprot:XP_018294201.1 hypothetical protein PHYBLDRAFT_59697 [Phycomyces blakesleeanus NRRL 1555(-)]
MAQNALLSTRGYLQRKWAPALTQLTCAAYGTSATQWFRRFLSPKEEKDLYLGLTATFRDKLTEKTTYSAKSYSNIIEQAILNGRNHPNLPPRGKLSHERMQEIPHAIDLAGKIQDTTQLEAIQREMEEAEISTVTLYNRLIRGFIQSNAIELADNVFERLQSNHLLPTTRTMTYLIRAHVKKNNLEKARLYVEKMQHLSLNKLRTAFDYSVMLEYSIINGDSHAVDFLWRDILKYAEIVKPGMGLYTQHLDYLTFRPELHSNLAEVAEEMLRRGVASPTSFQWNPHAGQILSKTVFTLAQNPEYATTSSQLLIFLIKASPHPWQPLSPLDQSINLIINAFLKRGQDLKALAFYYRLKRHNAPDNAFSAETTRSISDVLSKAEHRQHMDASQENKAILAEFSLLGQIP